MSVDAVGHCPGPRSPVSEAHPPVADVYPAFQFESGGVPGCLTLSRSPASCGRRQHALCPDAKELLVVVEQVTNDGVSAKPHFSTGRPHM